MPRIYPFGFIHVEIKYFYERNIGEHVDCHLAYISLVSASQQLFFLREGVSQKDIRRRALRGIFRVQRDVRVFSVSEPSEMQSIWIDDPGRAGKVGGATAGNDIA